MKVFYCLLLLLLGGFMVVDSPLTTAQRITQKYGSVPKGLILEGEASGIDKITAIKYLPKENRFWLNETDYYAVPVTREILYQIVMALTRDNRLGVSINLTDETIYGHLEKDGITAQQLLLADRLLTAVIIGNTDDLAGVTLPENFIPQKTLNRRYPAICVHKFFAYHFVKRENQYYRSEIKMANLLFPLANKRAVDGGYLAENISAHNLEPLDVENLATLRNYSQEYLQVPPIKQAANIGEVAAFIRYLQHSGNLDLVALARHIMRK